MIRELLICVAFIDSNVSVVNHLTNHYNDVDFEEKITYASKTSDEWLYLFQ